MPSSIAHGLAAAAVISLAYRGRPPAGALRAAVACAVLPDVDAIGRPFGIGDVGWLGGHRALTHSLAFAAALGGAVAAMAFRHRPALAGRGSRATLAAWLAVATALHGALDALSTYGEGIELLAPFTDVRVKAPWQPFDAILPEMLLVWLPALAVLALTRPAGVLQRWRGAWRSTSHWS
jgi:inner membrane protein